MLTPEASPKTPVPSARQKTYDELKNLILTGRLRPAERVAESRLAEQLGVSRTPLREALMKLEKEGLVVGRRNVGYSVVDVDLGSICELLVVREVLDARAAEIACETATDSDVQRIHEIVAEMEALHATQTSDSTDAARQLELGLWIHRVIAQTTRNEALIRICEQIYQQLQMALLLEVLWLDEDGGALAEHKAIADAIAARDPSAAASASRAHVQTSLQNMRKMQAIVNRRRRFKPTEGG